MGRPVAELLLNADATVTICHSKTKDVAAQVGRADILIVAIGKAQFVQGEWINGGGIVVLEENEKAEVPEAAGLTLIDERGYGETKVRFYKFSSPS